MLLRAVRAVCAAVGFAFVAVAAFAAGVHAQTSLALQQVRPGQITIDGDVGEWQGARWRELGNDRNASIEWTLGYDADAIYVAARVWDDDFVRTQRYGRREDAIVLTVSVPTTGRNARTTEVWLFAGVMAANPPSARVKLKKRCLSPRPRVNA